MNDDSGTFWVGAALVAGIILVGWIICAAISGVGLTGTVGG